MKLDEAIKNLSKHSELVLVACNPDLRAAVKLGIEALKAIRTGREDYYESQGHKLPGETEE